MIELKSYAAKTDQGPYLQLNEDNILVDIKNNLFVIIDGVGGVNIGDKVSGIVKDTILSMYTKFGGDSNSTFPFFFAPQYTVEGNALVNAMHLVHEEVKKENQDKDLSSKGAASATAVSFSDNIINIAHVGNCKALLLRSGSMKELVTPHTLAPLSRDITNAHFKTFPSNAFGLFDYLKVDLHELRIKENDILVLLSDGAYSRLVKDEIKYILTKNLTDLSKAIDEIFGLSNSRGNLDNQSALVFNF